MTTRAENGRAQIGCERCRHSAVQTISTRSTTPPSQLFRLYVGLPHPVYLSAWLLPTTPLAHFSPQFMTAQNVHYTHWLMEHSHRENPCILHGKTGLRKKPILGAFVEGKTKNITVCFLVTIPETNLTTWCWFYRTVDDLLLVPWSSLHIPKHIYQFKQDFPADY